LFKAACNKAKDALPGRLAGRTLESNRDADAVAPDESILRPRFGNLGFAHNQGLARKGRIDHRQDRLVRAGTGARA
jgi:hypothetical protein